MTPDQLTAAAKSKDANAICIRASGLWGEAQTVYMSVDRTVVDMGGMTVDKDCQVQFANQKAGVIAVPRSTAPGSGGF